MAVIKIKDLGAPGSMLFSDSESYLSELTEDELGVAGGMVGKRASLSISISVSLTVTYSWSWTW
jgi:hypothetical protein